MIPFRALLGILVLSAFVAAQPIRRSDGIPTAEPELLSNSLNSRIFLSKRANDAEVPDIAGGASHEYGVWSQGDTLRIATFLAGDHNIFPRNSLATPAVQQLAAVYRPYQRNFPARGLPRDGMSADAIVTNLFEVSGRNRLRQMQAVLGTVIDNALAFRLDRTRIQYLEALRRRFHVSEQILTPTATEIGDLALTRVPAPPVEYDSAYFNRMAEHIEWVARRMNTRQMIVTRTTPPLAINFALLGHLEDELDRVISTPSVPSRQLNTLLRLHPRDVAGDEAAHQGGPTRQRRDAWTSFDDEIAEEEALGSNLSTPRRKMLIKRQADVREHLGGQPWPMREMSVEEALGRNALEPTDPGAIPIAEFWRRNIDLLAPMRGNERRRQQLAGMYEQYQQVVPITGRALNFHDANAIVEQTYMSEGRNRFRHMTPILRYLVEHRSQLRLDPVRVAYLEALLGRFRETERLLTPSAEEHANEMLRHARIGEEDFRDVQVVRNTLHAVSDGSERILNRLGSARENLWRILQDLRFVNHLEKEIEEIVDNPVSPAARGVRRLVPRDGFQDQGADASINKDNTIEERAVKEHPHTDEEMRFALSGIGMHLQDQAARPIASWRLSDAMLLLHDRVPHDLKAVLRGGWVAYRANHPRIPFDHAFLSDQNRLAPYFNTDRGARFGSAIRVIDSLLSRRGRLQLTDTAVEYLEALKARFQQTAELMLPLPSAVRAEIRTEFSQGTAQEQEQMLRNLLFDRNLRIRRNAREVNIDESLLMSFEGEMDIFHRLPVV